MVESRKKTPRRSASKSAVKKSATTKTARPAGENAKKPARKKTARTAQVPVSAAVEPLAPGPATGIHHLGPGFGATHSRKRVGRGPGSGHGKTAGRGSKGQKSRSGYRHQRGFEGGQMPLHRRLPKRGFTNIFRVEYAPVNLSALDCFAAGEEVNPGALHAHGITGKGVRVKILGDGELKRALTVVAHRFSASARAKIEKAGGSCRVIDATAEAGR